MLKIKESTSETIINLDKNIQDIVLGANAKAYIYILENNDNIELNITQGENSYLELFVINSGQEIKIETNLNGENAIANIAGVYNLKNDDKNIIDINIKHNVPNCKSSQNFRGIAKDSSRANIRMMSYVAIGAIKTEANQLHKAMVMSDDAQIVSKPELEIYNEDVMCSHGNTVGNLDKSAIFYFQSRGVNKELAIKMLIDGFLDEVVKFATQDKIKEKIFALINEK